MQDRPIVLLLGTSLFVTGVEASLQEHLDLTVVRLDDALADIQESIATLRPDAIVFDSGESPFVTLPSLLQLLTQSSHIPIIGIDLSTNAEVSVYSTQQYRVVKSEDLVQAIHKVVQHGQE
ncbi:MAG: hypothetical protein HY328_11390 [Chloroflexi bacterium]|nr:hypothetical protein [Chloroflexota bacterium]